MEFQKILHDGMGKEEVESLYNEKMNLMNSSSNPALKELLYGEIMEIITRGKELGLELMKVTISYPQH